MFDDEVYYQALLASDTRFDGLFFVGISTTGIYCRPVCPARKARRSSCTFFATAAAAEEQGYRPCLRCRPELAPTVSPYDERFSNVSSVVAQIQAGCLNGDGSVDDLAKTHGLSARQLRRVVKDATGVSPVEIAQTSRLLLAKQLLTETNLSMTRVAFASGFSSLRRFNEAFVSSYELSPSRFRQNGKTQPPATITLRLSYRSPLAWRKLLAFLLPRAIDGIESVSDERYMRTVVIDGVAGWLEVRCEAKANVLIANVSPSLTPVLQPLLSRIRCLFDLYAQPDLIDRHLSESQLLAGNVKGIGGLRVPGSFDGFELAWRAVLGQQISVRAATTLAARFAQRFGEPLETPEASLRRVTPSPHDVACASVREIASIGLPSKRAETIRAMASLCAECPGLLSSGGPLEAARERLLSVPGVGPWTAEYIIMRALHWPDAFPDTDLGIRHAMGDRGITKIAKAAEAWRPWRAYAAIHLWTELGGAQ